MEVDIEYDADSNTYRAVHDFSSDRPLSTTVILVIEQVVDDAGLLYDAVDPDALDAVFRPRSDVAPYRRGQVEFDISDHLVTVRSDGVIEIEPDEDGDPDSGDDPQDDADG